MFSEGGMGDLSIEYDTSIQRIETNKAKERGN